MFLVPGRYERTKSNQQRTVTTELAVGSDICLLNISQVLVVCLNYDLVLGSVKPVPPFLLYQFHGQEFLVSNIIIPF